MVAYAEKIEGLARAFTPTCWALLYQAAARFRRDKLVHVQRIELKAFNEAKAEGRTHPYDPLRPWDRCYEMATESFHSVRYWAEQFERPGMQILTGARFIRDFLDGDAVIAANSDNHISTSYATPSDVGLANDGTPATRADHKKRPATGGGGGGAGGGGGGSGGGRKRSRSEDKPPPKQSHAAHNVSNGSYLTNRNNKQLCNAFQDGKCTNKNCPRGHQCSKCLGNHGASHPTPCKSTPKEKSSMSKQQRRKK